MSQSIAHACANCGSSVPENMRFCPNCGVPVSTEAAHHTPPRMAPSPPMYPQQQQQPVYQPVPGQQSYQPPVQNAQPPPAYARPQKNSSRRILKVGMILLILLVLLGAGGFFVFRSVSSRGGNAANTGAHSDVTPTQASLTTTPINTTFTYASVNITILNAQQATSFANAFSQRDGVFAKRTHHLSLFDDPQPPITSSSITDSTCPEPACWSFGRGVSSMPMAASRKAAAHNQNATS
ncbi:MAG: zinc-ribbon domain-containing protein [Ktedonobacteraceae bacterium]